jgi:hypothetical protein
VPFQLLKRRLKISKPGSVSGDSDSNGQGQFQFPSPTCTTGLCVSLLSLLAHARLTTKHSSKARAIHETRRQAAPHARDALRGVRLPHDVKGPRVLLWQVRGLHELELELAFDRFCWVGDGRAGVLVEDNVCGKKGRRVGRACRSWLFVLGSWLPAGRSWVWRGMSRLAGCGSQLDSRTSSRSNAYSVQKLVSPV